MYKAICIRHYWDHKDHIDDVSIIGEYNTKKEAIEHALCWEISENYDSDKGTGKYDELLISLTNLNFNSENEIEKFMNIWENVRYDYLYSDDHVSGCFVKIYKKQDNFEIYNPLGKAWYNYLIGKKDEAISYFKEYYVDSEVSEKLVDFFTKLGLPDKFLDTLIY